MTELKPCDAAGFGSGKIHGRTESSGSLGLSFKVKFEALLYRTSKNGSSWEQRNGARARHVLPYGDFCVSPVSHLKSCEHLPILLEAKGRHAVWQCRDSCPAS